MSGGRPDGGDARGHVVAILESELVPEAWLADMRLGEDVGATVHFVGLCRGEAGRLKALELEHYPGMAEAEINRIADAAAERWPLFGLVAVHRTGLVPVGQPIVVVAAASAHRAAAFDAARFVMDFLKTEAPFWKREHLTDGSVGPWVEATDADERARGRWTEPAIA